MCGHQYRPLMSKSAKISRNVLKFPKNPKIYVSRCFEISVNFGPFLFRAGSGFWLMWTFQWHVFLSIHSFKSWCACVNCCSSRNYMQWTFESPIAYEIIFRNSEIGPPQQMTSKILYKNKGTFFIWNGSSRCSEGLFINFWSIGKV